MSDEPRYKNLYLLIAILVVVIGLIIIFQSNITGMVVTEQPVIGHVQMLELEVTGSMEETVVLEQYTADFNLVSVALSGSMKGNARVYLADPEGNRYLVLDGDSISPTVQSSAEKVQIAELVPAESVEDRVIQTVLEYASGSNWDVDDDGVEYISDGVVDLTVEDTLFNWEADESMLCTKWTVRSVDSENEEVVCNGAADCCALVGAEPEAELWDSPLYVFHTKYGAGEDNEVNAQVVFLNQSAGNETYFESTVGSESMLPVVFVEDPAFEFENICVETCELPVGLNTTEYVLVFELDPGAEVFIESMNYTIENLAVDRAVEEVEIYAEVKDSDGDILPATVKFKDRHGKLKEEKDVDGASAKGTGGVSLEKNKVRLKTGMYDVEINMTDDSLPVKSIKLHNVDVESDNTDFFRIDDVEETEDNARFVQAYAIDPTEFDFSSAEVTVVAQGDKLYKCKLWDFGAERCYGEWELFKTGLVPGQEYTFTLTPGDPGFGEEYADCDQNLTSCQLSGLTANTKYCLNQSVSTSGDCMVLDADNITLDCKGHSIINTDPTGGSSDYGIELRGTFSNHVEDVTVTNCTVHNFGRGIYLNYADNSNISHNILNDSSYYGAYISNSLYNLFNDNEFNETYYNYDIYFSSTNYLNQTFVNNRMDGSEFIFCNSNSSWSLSDFSTTSDKMTRYGAIILYYCDNAVLQNLTIANHATSDSGYGGLFIHSSDNVNVQDSNFTDNENGIRIDYSDNFIVNNSVFHSSDTAGIYMQQSNNGNFTLNRVTGNTYGTYITGGNDDNLFEDNDLVGNNYGFYISSSGNDYNEFYGNEINSSTSQAIHLGSLSYTNRQFQDNIVDGYEFYFCYNNDSWSLSDYIIPVDRVTDFGAMIIIDCDNAALQNVTIANHANANSGYGGLTIYSSDNVNIQDSNFTDNENGISLYQSNNAVINESILVSNDNAAIYLYQNNEYGLVTNNDMLLNNYGIYISSSGNNYNEFYDNEINGSATYDIYFSSDVYTDQYFINNHVDGYLLYHCYNNNSFSLSDYTIDIDKVSNYGPLIISNCNNAALQNITIANHATAASGYGGLYIYSSENVTLQDSNFTDNENGVTLRESQGAVINKSVMHSNDYAGIYFYSDNPNGEFNDNNITSNSYGIRITSSGNDDNRFFGNQINASSTYAIDFSSFSYANQNFSGNKVDGYDFHFCRNNNSFSLSDYTIDIDKVTNFGPMILYYCDNAVLQNITIANHITATGGYGGLTLYYSDYVTVQDSNFTDDEVGMRMDYSDYVTINNTVFHSSDDNGLDVRYSDYGTLFNSTFTDHTGSSDAGLYMYYDTDRWNVSYNMFVNNYYNLYTYGGSGSNLITYNNFTYNNFSTPASSSSYNLYMYYYGENNRFVSNTFENGNKYNYIYYYNDNNEFIENDFYGTSYMVRIYSTSNDNNLFYRNNFRNTSAYASPLVSSTDSNNYFNTSAPDGGNYWGNYQAVAGGPCVDTTPADGFCDTEYSINGNEKDFLPYVTPVGAPNLTTPLLNVTAQLYEDTDVMANTTYSDAQGSSGNVTFYWYVDNVNVYNESFPGTSVGSSVYSNLSNTNYSKGSYVNVSVDANDGELTSDLKWSATVLVVDAELPQYDSFDGETTDFLSEPDLQNVDNLRIENTSQGRVRWLQNSRNVSEADFDTHLKFGDNWIWVDSANLNENLNSSANITFYGLAFVETPVVLEDGAVCSDCAVLGYDSDQNLTFNVTHFTNYSAGANANLTIWDQNDTGMPYGDQAANVSEELYFYANYTNVTANAIITGADCNITFSDGATSLMTYNATKTVYEYNRTFSLEGPYSWNVSCNKTGYETLNTTDSIIAIIPGQPECGNLIAASKTLTQDLQNSTGGTLCSGHGLVINADNIVVDCAGYNITGDGSGAGQGINITGRTNVTVKNCNISGFQTGVYATLGSENNITNNSLHDNTVHGIYIQRDDNSVATSNTIYDNDLFGIYINVANNTLVDSCTIYNHTKDILIAGGGAFDDPITINFSNTTIRNPSGTLENYTVLDIDDVVPILSVYHINWTVPNSSVRSQIPYTRETFNDKFVEVKRESGSVYIERISWRWDDSELGGTAESTLELWVYNESSGSWSLLNNTPDTSANELSMTSLYPASMYGIMNDLTNSTLVVFDDNDPQGGSQGKEYDQLIMFYANYSNRSDSLPITDASCSVNFSTTPSVFYDMTYNATSTYFEYNRSFYYADNITYSVNCSHNAFTNLTETDDVKPACPAGTLEITTNVTFTSANASSTVNMQPSRRDRV
jgi:parallel beta-helix repeat protein